MIGTGARVCALESPLAAQKISSGLEADNTADLHSGPATTTTTDVSLLAAPAAHMKLTAPAPRRLRT